MPRPSRFFCAGGWAGARCARVPAFAGMTDGLEGMTDGLGGRGLRWDLAGPVAALFKESSHRQADN